MDGWRATDGPSLLATDAATDLIAAARAGDEEAMTRLLEEAVDFLFPFILALLRARKAQGTYISDTLASNDGAAHSLEEDAWDLTHNTCLAMLKGLHTYRGKSRFGRSIRFTTWLYAIAQNEVRSTLRKRWRERKRRFTLANQRDSEEHGRSFVAEGDQHPTPEEAAMAQVEHKLLKEALEKAPLTPEQRDAVIMFYVLGYKQERIARLTGVQVGTVKKRIFDGLRKLRRYMDEVAGDATGTGGV